MEKDECEFGVYCSVAKYKVDSFFPMAAGASGSPYILAMLKGFQQTIQHISW